MGEDHEEEEEPKHICKLCSRVFPCGRSLGGHMRSHLITVPRERIPSRRQPNRALENPCRQCGRTFHSLKALFGHMKCHKPPGEEASSSDATSQTTAAPTRKKRSGRLKKKDAVGLSSSLSEIEQQEQEEVALSLIILSMDRGEWCNEPEVSSKEMIKRRRSDHEYSEEVQDSCKFTCSICRRRFLSYQALGGHRASHKKFKGCCAPPAENTTSDSPNRSTRDRNSAKGKEHECPICLKVFPSGQALGGHKRSHLVADQAESRRPSEPAQSQRRLIDLNLPAPPDEEECSDFKPWWITSIGLLST